jgi:secreted trypsin-like serine protease
MMNPLLKASQIICLLLLTLKQPTTISALPFPRELIVKGSVIDYKRHPYFTYFYFLDEFESYGCGGSLIAPDIVLTAAQCVEKFDEKNLTAIAWVNITIGSVNPFDYKADVEEVMIHPKFSFSNFYNNDLAIVKLSRSFFGIPLLKINKFPITPEKLHVVGYGSVAEGQKTNDILSATVSEIPFEECNSGKFFSGNIQKSSMLCAGRIGTSKKVKGTLCDGDVGGPLISKGIDTSHDIQYGIASVYVGCGTEALPDIYVRLSTYASWIQDNVCLLSDIRPCPTITAASSSPTLSPTKGRPKPSKPSKKPSFQKPSKKPFIKRPTKTPTGSPIKKPTK